MKLSSLLARTALPLVLVLHAPASTAQPVLANPTLSELREAFAAPAPISRSFRRTAPPSTDGLCPGAQTQNVKPGSQPTSTSRTLEVVPYAGDDGRRVNLAIQFALDSDAIASSGRAVLDRVATVLNEPGMGKARFAIAGHTDASGSVAHNLELSCARALAARSYLLERGISAARVSAYGFGSSRPLQGGIVDSAIDRRVEFRLED